MITLTLGLVISGAIIQVLVSSSVTNKLNQAVAQVQESGRFIMARLSAEFYEVGRFGNDINGCIHICDYLIITAYFIEFCREASHDKTA